MLQDNNHCFNYGPDDKSDNHEANPPKDLTKIEILMHYILLVCPSFQTLSENGGVEAKGVK